MATSKRVITVETLRQISFEGISYTDKKISAIVFNSNYYYELLLKRRDLLPVLEVDDRTWGTSSMVQHFYSTDAMQRALSELSNGAEKSSPVPVLYYTRVGDNLHTRQELRDLSLSISHEARLPGHYFDDQRRLMVELISAGRVTATYQGQESFYPDKTRIKDEHLFCASVSFLRDAVMSRFQIQGLPKIGGGLTHSRGRPVAYMEFWYIGPDPKDPSREIDNDEGIVCLKNLTEQEEQRLDDIFVAEMDRLPGFTAIIGYTVCGRRQYRIFAPDSARTPI